MEKGEYNEEDKTQIILINVAKMLSRRRNYLHIPYEEILEQFKKNLSAKKTFYENDKTKILLNITFDKLKKLEKADEKEFMNDVENVYKILVAYKATSKIIQFFEKQLNSELVFVSEVLIDRAEHVSNPVFILLSEEEQKQVKEELNMTDEDFPVIKIDDPMSRYFQLRKGEIIEVNMPSITSGLRVSYSICK